MMQKIALSILALLIPAGVACADVAASRDGAVSMGALNRPESILFMLMRNLSATPAGVASYELRRQIEQWRILTHDRKRKIGVRWTAPEEFVRRRKAFRDYLKDAQEELRQAKRYARATTPRDKARKRRHKAAAYAVLQQAAKAWADPLLRDFLLATADLRGRNYTRAQELFLRCRRTAPLVAAFHQGYAMALAGLNRPTDAVSARLAALRLRPGSTHALEQLHEAMKKVPGAKLKTPAYEAAEEFLVQYGETPSRSRFARRGMTWLLPGDRGVTVRDETIPLLPYDRLVFRQGAGAAVGEKTLLVDAQVVRDALAVFIRIDEYTIVPARVGRSRSSRDRTKPLLAVVTTDEYVFTPLAVRLLKNPKKNPDTQPAFSKDQAVTAYGIGAFREMGSTLRKASGKITEVGQDGSVEVSVHLAPGESAGPVVTEDGTLVGFLAARTDIHAEDGGKDEFIADAEIARLLKRLRRSYRSSGRYGYSRVKRTITPKPAEGQVFIVYAITGELSE